MDSCRTNRKKRQFSAKEVKKINAYLDAGMQIGALAGIYGISSEQLVINIINTYDSLKAMGSKVADYNEQCVRLCNNGASCGKDGNLNRCGVCPKDMVIDL